MVEDDLCNIAIFQGGPLDGLMKLIRPGVEQEITLSCDGPQLGCYPNVGISPFISFQSNVFGNTFQMGWRCLVDSIISINK